MLRATLLVLGCCMSAIAAAADNGFYIGVGATQSDYGLDNPGDLEPFEDKDDGYKAIVGFRLLDSFGVEVNYIDHGEATLPAGPACIPLVGIPCPATTSLEAQTVSAFAVGFLHFPVIDLFAKAGGAAWNLEASSAGATVDDAEVEFAWGVGAQAHFGSLGARLEYENFSVVEDEEIGTISLSFIYTFL